MDATLIARDIVIGTLATVLGALLLGGIAWLVWPFRWRVQGRAIQKLISGERRFNFIFDPESKLAKEVTFLRDGRIGEGRNHNEQTWRIRKGALEILASDGKIYSRFRHDRGHGVLINTNDPELRSNPGQYLQPRLVDVPRDTG